MNKEQLIEYAEDNWVLDPHDEHSYKITVTFDYDAELVGMLSFAMENLVFIGCPIDVELEAVQAKISGGPILLVPTSDGDGQVLARVAEISEIDFEQFDEMYDDVFDTAYDLSS